MAFTVLKPVYLLEPDARSMWLSYNLYQCDLQMGITISQKTHLTNILLDISKSLTVVLLGLENVPVILLNQPTHTGLLIGSGHNHLALYLLNSSNTDNHISSTPLITSKYRVTARLTSSLILKVTN